MTGSQGLDFAILTGLRVQEDICANARKSTAARRKRISARPDGDVLMALTRPDLLARGRGTRSPSRLCDFVVVAHHWACPSPPPFPPAFRLSRTWVSLTTSQLRVSVSCEGSMARLAAPLLGRRPLGDRSPIAGRPKPGSWLGSLAFCINPASSVGAGCFASYAQLPRGGA